MEPEGIPGGSEKKDGQARDGAGDESVAEGEVGQADLAGEEAGAGRGEGVGEEIAGGGAMELSYSTKALGAEDREAGGALGQIEDQRREARDRAEEHSTRITAKVWSVIGTAVKNRGSEMCAQMATRPEAAMERATGRAEIAALAQRDAEQAKIWGE